MAGEINGTDVGIAYDHNIDNIYADLGGIMTQSYTINNTPIDLTDKDSGSWTELMGGEGLQNVEITSEVIFSSDAVFSDIRSIALSKLSKPFRIVRGGYRIDGFFMVSNYTETSPDNDKLTASFTLVSDGDVTETLIV